MSMKTILLCLAATGALWSAGAHAQDAAAAKALATKSACMACHAVDKKLVGPAFKDVAAKHKGKADLEAYLMGKIQGGSSGVYGAIPMPPQPQLSEADARSIARWIVNGAK